MDDYLLIFLVTNIVFLILALLFIWRDTSGMPMRAQAQKRQSSRIT
jgi:branched-subunit amino acid ABC-type transport system permease component